MFDIGVMFQVVATAVLFMFGSYVTYRQRVKLIKKLQHTSLGIKEETAL